MPISPLTPGAFKATNAARMLINTRGTLDDLQRQLATGKKSETYGGLGAARITSLEMRAKAFEVRGYQETVVHSQIRVKQLDLSLTQLSKISDEVRSSTILPQFNPDSTGKTSMQKYARTRFDEAVDVLNSEINGVRLFSGRSTDVRPVLDANTILNGDSAGRAGVQQLTLERKAADLGTGTGRLVLGGAGSVATLTEDGSHPLGFKLTAGSSTSAGISAVVTRVRRPILALTSQQILRMVNRFVLNSHCRMAQNRLSR
jgi:flagellar hook-associated protein 3 FlgL